MRGIIGTKNAGFEIIEAMRTTPVTGFCIGRKHNQYVTWWFSESLDGKSINFYYGHYYNIDPDAPMRTAHNVKADYCRRLMEAYENMAQYGT